MITAKVYQAASPSTLIASLDQRREPQWLDQLNDPGSGSVKIHERDPILVSNPSLVDYDNIVRMAIDGTDVFAFVVQGRSKPPAPKNEEAGRWWELSGRGVLALLGDVIVYPEVSGTSPVDRTFGWMAVAFDDSGWSAATEIQRQDAGTPVTDYSGYPTGWPDPLAYWIWSRGLSGGAMPAGTSYFRKTFTLGSATPTAIFASCDNAFDLWIDDEKVIENLAADPSHIGWNDPQRFDRWLGAGDHTIAVQALNERGATFAAGPAGLIVTVVETTIGGQLSTTILERTDNSWLADDYPAEVPGMTPGEILSVLVSEAQTRGGLTGITLGFDGASDSNSAYWDASPDIAFQVGSNYLDVVKVLAEQYIDVKMTPELVLEAYNTGTLGSDLTGSVSLLIGKDFEELTGSEDEPIGATHLSNVVLAREQSGTLTEHTEPTSLAGHKRKESYLEMATAPSAGQSARAAEANFVDLSLPSVQLQGMVTKASGPYTAWEVGDIIDVPDLFLIQTATLVLTLSVSEDEAGNEIFSFIGSQDDLTS